MATSKLGFAGRVAVITGAGGGLGREYALEFARRGASVVVNDLGGSFKGEGKSTSLADKVVKEIVEKGGRAVANYDSVEDGEKIIDTAIQNFGKVDILINNAGILRDRTFANMSDADWDKVFQVHVNGAFKVTRAAWQHMRKQRYGRIIMTTSPAGLYGNFGQSNYSAAKMALHGLCKTLSIEGKSRNISVNTIAPLAVTRMTLDIFPEGVDLKPEHVCPFVVYLCHESCQESGSLIEAAGGFACKSRLQRSRGIQLRQFISDNPTVETVAESWDKLTDFTFPTICDSSETAASQVMDSLKDVPAEPLPPNATIVERMQAARIPESIFMYTASDVIRYALSIGAGLPDDVAFIYEGHPEFCVIPSFATCMSLGSLFTDILTVPGFDQMDLSRLVHGEHYIELFKPLPTSGQLTNRARVIDCLDKRKFEQVILETDTYDENNELICKNQYVLLFLGSSGTGRRGKCAAQVQPQSPPNRAPDFVFEEKTDINQAAYYRLNGDFNPLHIDQDVAKMTGFDVPILHGLCTFGYSLRHIMKTFVKHDTSQFKAIKGQFSKPVIPGQTLITEMWSEGGTRVHFRTKVKENGNVVIKGGFVDFRQNVQKLSISPPPQAATAPPPTTTNNETSSLKADTFFNELKTVLSSSPDLVKSVTASYLFQITVDGKVAGEYLLDFKSSPPKVSNVGANTKADVTIKVSDDDLVALAEGKLNPMQGFMQGKIKLSGQIGLAQKLDTVFKAGKQKLTAQPSPTQSTNKTPKTSSLKAASLLDNFKEKLNSVKGLDKVKGSFLFKITKANKLAGEWLLNFNQSPPVLSVGPGHADVTVTIDDDDFVSLVNGKLSGPQAYFQGKLKVAGKLMLMQRLGDIFKSYNSKL